MLSKKQEIYLQANQLIDAIILGAFFWGSHLIRDSLLYSFGTLSGIPPFYEFFWVLAIIIPMGPFLLELQGFYDYPLEKTIGKSLSQIAKASIILGLILGLCIIFLRVSMPSRSVFLLFLILTPAGLLIRERLFAYFYLRKIKKGTAGEEIVIAGEPKKIKEILDSFTPAQRLEIKVLEEIDLESLGVEALLNALHRTSVGRVLLAFENMKLLCVQEAIRVCETEGVEAWLSSDFIKTSIARPAYESFGGRPMLVFRSTPELSWTLLLKNTFDRIAAFILLLCLLPVFLCVAILIKWTMPGPVFFTQMRAGRYGKPFRMYKFRSMIVGADKQQEELKALNEMDGPVFKITKDPRVTSLGHWLRKTSIDELPQLYNVLTGTMSFVGPRPLPVYEVESFALAAHRRRLSMKPGLTCLWQIQGRNDIRNFSDWVKMDLFYIDNWSLTLDFKILLRTIPIVFGGFGAR